MDCILLVGTGLLLCFLTWVLAWVKVEEHSVAVGVGSVHLRCGTDTCLGRDAIIQILVVGTVIGFEGILIVLMLLLS